MFLKLLVEERPRERLSRFLIVNLSCTVTHIFQEVVVYALRTRAWIILKIFSFCVEYGSVRIGSIQWGFD